jgi:hypothetical protein
MKSHTLSVAALFGLLAAQAYSQVTLTDLGTTAPTTFDTGYTGTFDNRYGFDGPISPATTPVESHGQSFLPATTGNLEYLYMAYNAGGLGSFKVHIDTNYAGGGVAEIVADSNTAGTAFTINIASFISGGLSGSSANGNGSPVYWMKIDLSNQGVALTSGQTAAFAIVAVSETASDSNFIFAPHYKGTSNPYAGGAVITGSGFTTPPAGSDFGFAVSVRLASDTDGDGLNDAWELSFDGITTLDDLDGTLPAGSGPGSGSGDFDGDGLSDLAEFTVGTNPTLTDTDGDNISDKNEIDAKNAAGVAHAYGATSPLLPDSDADGIRDDYELEAKNAAGVAHAFGATNPNSNDSDSDGMRDLYELTNNLLGGLNPNTDDAAGNLDGDASGWTNLDEYLGTNTGGVQTRADKLDTDGDTLEDIVENKSGSWTDVSATGTNPTVLDTDNDGLNDNLENPDLTFPGSGVTPTNSNPNIADTDADGLRDSAEVNLGTDPVEPDSDGDTYEDRVEVLNGSNPALASSVPASTAVFAGTDFGSLSWLNTGGGVTADASSPLLPGSGSNGLLNNNLGNTGAMVSFANPAAVAYYSIDVRYTGTLNGDGVNVVSSNNLTVQTGNFNHCSLRLIPGGTFAYMNGGTYTPIAPITSHQADHTYTVQFVHDIPANTYTIRVYDRSASDAVILEITPAVPTRNTTPAGTLFFGAGIQQNSTSDYQLRLDNLWVSTAPIAPGSAPTNDFTAWASANGANGQSASDDHDGDGVENGVEYFMGQTGSSFTAMPVPDATRKVSWTKNADYLGTFAVQTSPDLVGWTTVAHTVNGSLIEYTLPTGQGKIFTRLAVDPQ